MTPGVVLVNPSFVAWAMAASALSSSQDHSAFFAVYSSDCPATRLLLPIAIQYSLHPRPTPSSSVPSGVDPTTPCSRVLKLPLGTWEGCH
jgi:hypothetical protein